MIKNKTSDTILSQKEIICKTFFSQTIGLMFHKRANLIMQFPQERTISLHNFFVFYPIDIIILNKQKQVIEIKRNFRPFTFYNPKNKGMYCIELGKDQLDETTKIGDQLQIS